MIRLIQERDYSDLMTLLNEDAIVNYFILISYYGDLNKLALVYGFFEENRLESVLVIRNSGNAQFYSTKRNEDTGLKALLEAHNVKGLIAEKTCGEAFAKRYGFFGTTQATVMDLYPKALMCQQSKKTAEIIELSGSDAGDIKKLYAICFAGSLSEAQIQKNLQEHTGRGLAIIIDDRIVSVVQTIFERPDYAILFGVATDPDYRGRGYATVLLEQLLVGLVTEGKSVHLMVEDPIAASLYRKLGFVERTTLEKYQLI